ncbi:MAG: hypothetical protein RIS44_1241 [Pseudomonadota bacterium]|jgi:hypothetical protein
MNSEVFTGQTITCGAWSLALKSPWAHTIVDTFELVAIPRAPLWLVGAVNINGSIVPVVDFAAYFAPDARHTAADKHQRILIGGRRDEGMDEAATHDSVFAVLFNGLPMEIEYTREAVDVSTVLPERLKELCIGMARRTLDDGSDSVHFEMNTDRFMDFLSLSLM